MRAKGITAFLCLIFLSRAYAVDLFPDFCFNTPEPVLHAKRFVYSPIGYNNPSIIEQFSATSDGKKVTLVWKSNPEKKSDFFTIERSKDGVTFSTCLIVKGSGHNNYILDYTEMDFSPLPGLSYYRIKQTDYEGHFLYSTVIPVNFHLGKDGHSLAEKALLPEESELAKIENKQVLVVLRDAAGSEFTSKVLVSKQNEMLVATDTQNNLHSGAYTVVASSANALYAQRLTIR